MHRQGIVAILAETILQKFQRKTTEIQILQMVKDKLKSISNLSYADKQIIIDFQHAKKDCQSYKKHIALSKETKFKDFKSVYYKQNQQLHAEFQEKKQKLYKTMQKLNGILQVTSEEWNVFATDVYSTCSKNSQIPVPVVF
jgi:hypothetical protein